jgi:hypothetical protein
VPAPLVLIALLLSAPQAQPPPDTDEDDAQAVAAAAAARPAAQPAPGQPVPASEAQPQPLEPLIHKPIVRPFEMPNAFAPSAPMPYADAPAAEPKQAVPVERYEGDYEGKADEAERYYQSGVQSHFQAEQAMMGALDGEWTVAGKDGRALFDVILNDAGAGAALEGAWRDLRADHSRGMGVIDTVQFDRASLTLSFHSGGGDRLEPTVVTLKTGPDGRWQGEINDAGAIQPVVMNHVPAVPPPS